MFPTSAPFPTSTAGLPEATASTAVDLADGDTFELRIGPVAKRLGSAVVRMLAYNGSVPGPTLRVRQGTELTVVAVNGGDLETSVHWHGLRLDNSYDGVPGDTQTAIPVGGWFTYRLRFPDPGGYWYHPHVREDYTQELGLYGCIIVTPTEAGYWPPVNREVVLTLDDLLLVDGAIAPFSPTVSTHVAMGRFGNVMLVAGEPELALSARAGEVVRLYLTNTANARVFNVRLPGARLRLVGGDSGRYERTEAVREVLLGPSERAVVDALFERPGRVVLEHRTPDRSYPLATVTVAEPWVTPSLAYRYPVPHVDPELAAERDRLEEALGRPPDRTLAMVAELADLGGEHHHHHGAGPLVGGIEWEDEMPEMNAQTTTANTRWMLVDRDTGAVNADIDWRFQVGQRVKIRLVNELDSDHPMPHPFHIHGAGRFLVLARDGAVEPNLVWKDTVLVRTGQQVDILLDVTNPGRWMAHCHIAEHLQGGMMFSFEVEPTQA